MEKYISYERTHAFTLHPTCIYYLFYTSKKIQAATFMIRSSMNYKKYILYVGKKY
jgi:hypothetical protein